MRFSTALPAWGVRRLASIQPVVSRLAAPSEDARIRAVVPVPTAVERAQDATPENPLRSTPYD